MPNMIKDSTHISDMKSTPNIAMYLHPTFAIMIAITNESKMWMWGHNFWSTKGIPCTLISV